MVVLSRRPHESILIPAIGARIHVAAIEPDVVRVAIDAPPEVAVLRGEIQDRAAQPPIPVHPGEKSRAPAGARRRFSRATRQRLQAASIRIGLARLQLRAGLVADAQAALAKVHEEIQRLRRRLEGRHAQLSPRRAVTPPRMQNQERRPCPAPAGRAGRRRERRAGLPC